MIATHPSKKQPEMVENMFSVIFNYTTSYFTHNIVLWAN